VTASGATLNAVVNTQGLTGSYVFQYGISSTALSSTTGAKALSASANSAKAAATLTGLKGAMKYYYRVVVTTGGGTATGETVSFTTE
jgi:hypothetical protein